MTVDEYVEKMGIRGLPGAPRPGSGIYDEVYAINNDPRARKRHEMEYELMQRSEKRRAVTQQQKRAQEEMWKNKLDNIHLSELYEEATGKNFDGTSDREYTQWLVDEGLVDPPAGSGIAPAPPPAEQQEESNPYLGEIGSDAEETDEQKMERQRQQNGWFRRTRARAKAEREQVDREERKRVAIRQRADEIRAKYGDNWEDHIGDMTMDEKVSLATQGIMDMPQEKFNDAAMGFFRRIGLADPEEEEADEDGGGDIDPFRRSQPEA